MHGRLNLVPIKIVTHVQSLSVPQFYISSIMIIIIIIDWLVVDMMIIDDTPPIFIKNILNSTYLDKSKDMGIEGRE